MQPTVAVASNRQVHGTHRALERADPMSVMAKHVVQFVRKAVTIPKTFKMNASSKILLRSMFIASLLASVSAASLAQTTPTTTTSPSSVAQENYTLGEIKKIDASTKRLTIKHEAIKHLDMPGMTMVFQASEAKLLDGLSANDRVSFLVESRAGAMVVTDIRRVKS